jgi:hypothetical protein
MSRGGKWFDMVALMTTHDTLKFSEQRALSSRTRFHAFAREMVARGFLKNIDGREKGCVKSRCYSVTIKGRLASVALRDALSAFS